MLCEADTVDTGAMWECPLLLKLSVVPEHGRHSMLSGLSGLRSLSNSYNNISTFHPSSNGNIPTSPTAAADRKFAGSPPTKQTGFSPRKGVAPALLDVSLQKSEDGKEPPPGGGGVTAVRAKSALSEELANPYADPAGTDATM